jgi:hypothetical protein
MQINSALCARNSFDSYRQRESLEWKPSAEVYVYIARPPASLGLRLRGVTHESGSVCAQLLKCAQAVPFVGLARSIQLWCRSCSCRRLRARSGWRQYAPDAGAAQYIPASTARCRSPRRSPFVGSKNNINMVGSMARYHALTAASYRLCCRLWRCQAG